MNRLLAVAALVCTLISSLYADVFVDRSADSLELVKLYNNTEGDAWFESWELSNSMSTWKGVTLNDSGQVVVINLSNNNLKGSIPSLNLPALNILRLSSNFLREGLPSFTQMKNLVFLELQNNMLDGGLRDFDLPNLNNLDLSRNQLTGGIPDFSGMPSLVTLKLSFNELSGGIPNFSHMGNLINLLLSNNNLDGMLPDFDHVEELITLDVHSNNLGFNVPELGNLTTLFVLDLSDNNFTGFLPNFRRSSLLDRLRVNDNNFAGPLPNLGRLTQLRHLDVSNCNFGGQISSFAENTKLEVLNLDGNLFEGEIPDFSTLTELEVLDLSDNSFTDTLPSLAALQSLEELYLDSNLLVHSHLDASMLASLQILTTHFNYFTFQDLEAINGLSITDFNYAPQRRIIMPDTIIATINDDVTFDLIEDEGFGDNTYQWFLNEEFVDARAVNKFTVSNINALDEGIYYAIVKNDGWPALSLFSEEILLIMNCPFNQVVVVDSICFGDTIMVNKMPYFETGNYTDTIIVNDPATCDSVFLIDLTVLPVYDTTLLDTICQSDQVMFAGQVITESGTYTDTLSSQDGCDSIVHLELVVRPAFEKIRVDSICAGDTLFIGHFAHTESGIFKDTLQSVYGCDSIFFTDLTVLDTSLSVTSVSLCLGETYEFRGVTYSESGTYVDATTNSIGCDSTFVLNLSIPSTDRYFEQQVICAGDSIVFGDTVIRMEGIYVDSLMTENGCDSIVELEVVVVEKYDEEFDITLCTGDTLFFGGDTVTSTGIYIDSLLAHGGCDSIIKARVEFVPFLSRTIDTTLCFGDSLVIKGKTYKDADLFRDTLDGGVCDTILLLRVSLADPIVLESVKLRLNESNVGSITPTVSGGMGALTYSWSNGSQEASLDSVSEGTYMVTITDEIGCAREYEFVLDATTADLQLNSLSAQVNLYPNPVMGQHLYLEIAAEPGNYKISIIDLYGRVVLHKDHRMHRKQANIDLDLATLTSGMYHLRLSNDRGRTLVRHLVVH